MAEETKETGKKPMAILKIILGIALIVLGVILIINWWTAVWILITGCLGAFLVLAGLITVMIARE